MTSKSRSKPKTSAAELTEREIDAWVLANKEKINKDLAAARKSVRTGGARDWSFAKFVARAQKRSAAKKKK